MRLVIAAAAAALTLAATGAAAQNAALELRPGETLVEVEAEGVHRSRPEIEPGEIETTIEVWVDYALAPL